MDESSIDEEREALNLRRREISRKLQALTAQNGTLDVDALEMRREPLLSQIREIERRLADIDLDACNLSRMEGGE